jgi:glycosyltransferase involved in cell wall biosynthesis
MTDLRERGGVTTVTYPLVSVAVPTRGRPELLRLTITSIVEQDYEGAIEVVVVHDKEDADPTLSELGRRRRTVRAVTNDGAPGLAGARNTGLRLTTGEIVASCDDDDLWHPGKIRKQVHRLLADPELLAVGTGIRLVMSPDHVVDWPGKDELVSHQRLLGSRVKELHSSTLAMRRVAFDKAGEYDESLPNGYAEDYDWLLRASRVGRVGVVTEPLADIRKDVPSWFRDRADTTVEAFEYLLDKHQDLRTHRRGHARILGQIAYAHATAGRRRVALRTVVRALSRYPLAPQAWLAFIGATSRVDPSRVLKMARTFGRGVS